MWRLVAIPFVGITFGYLLPPPWSLIGAGLFCGLFLAIPAKKPR